MSLTAPSRHPLRKSCSFCRARKIKCSNETICEACRKHNVDCIYFDADPPRPKARTISQDSTRALSLQGDFGLASSRSRSLTGGASSCNGSPRGSPRSVVEEPGVLASVGAGNGLIGHGIDGVEDVAAALDKMFAENSNLYESSAPRSSRWQTGCPDSHPRTKHTAHTLSPRNIKYTGILSLLTHDLVGLVVDKFGALGCHHVEGGGAGGFLADLARDDTSAMFDGADVDAAAEGPRQSNPLAKYGTRQITQMVDVWFSAHPLSFLVSKTLLLRELRDGTHDEVLLATMLADASFSIGDDAAVTRGHALLRWATSQLRHRPLNSRQGPAGGRADGLQQQGISIAGISTAQALMLMGWNALCRSQIRRASCYISLAGRLATNIRDQIAGAAASPLTTPRINGVDVFEVEKELVAYLWWTTYSLTLWMSMQMGNDSSSSRPHPLLQQQLLLPTSLASIFLPADDSTSALIRLDEVSDNFSTLQRQKAMMREMWPLAHIASLVAYIYALYPHSHDSDGDAAPHSTSFWPHEAPPLLALQRMQHGAAAAAPDIPGVCREVYCVLMESTHLLNRQVAPAPGRSLVLVVYHTMAVHMQFPRRQPLLLSGSPLPRVTPEVIERFVASAQEIIALFAQVAAEQAPAPLALVPGQGLGRASFPDMFCLALDTCARALSHIHSQKTAGQLHIEPQLVPVYNGRLKSLAHQLHALTLSDFLNPASSLRVVKKHLKLVLRAFGSSTAATSSHHIRVTSTDSHAMSVSSSGSGTPDMARRPSTTSHPSSRQSSSQGSLHATPALLPIHPDMDHLSAASFITPMDTHSTGSAATSDAPEITTPFIPFSPLTDHDIKPDWRAADDLFHHVMDPSALGAPTNGMPELVDMHSPWFQGQPMLMDLDMGATNLGGSQWEWASADLHDTTTVGTTLHGNDMDSVLYFLERGGNRHA